MNYTSTRNKATSVSSARAIVQGMSQEGGLFVPCSLPRITKEQLADLAKQDYITRACSILSGFLTDFTPEELKSCVNGAYGEGFDDPAVAPLSKLGESLYLLELWHGPTCAFKDMALQLLPHLMTTAAKKTGEERTIVILVATSGDTGKAALEGFKDIKGTKIVVFYPQDGVSPMQKLQMATQEGENVTVCSIEGNFDDAQSGVKVIFGNAEAAKRLSEKGMVLSSANSINWGRLVPQIVYYISAYCDLLAEGEIAPGETVNVTVPTGNFGNIMAAYYAREMGLPIGKLICASNRNNVLTDFILTGVYDRNRDFFATTSPSMDILISSNLERLLYHLSDEDDKLVTNLMTELRQTGRYQVPQALLTKLQGLFWGGYCDDKRAADTIRSIFESYSYLPDTHTAVALAVYQDYAAATGDKTKTILASTANPYKFSGSVLAALDPAAATGDEFELVQKLAEKSGVAVPAPIAELSGKAVRFTDCCPRDKMLEYLYQALEA